MDRKSSVEIMELLKKLSEERLVIVITHDKKCAEYAEQTVTIADGKLCCENLLAVVNDSAKLKTKNTPKLSLLGWAFKNFRVNLRRYIAVALAICVGVVCFALSLSSGNIMEQAIADFEAKNTAYHNGYIKTDGGEEEILKLLSKDSRIENAYAQYVLKDVSAKICGQTVNMSEKYPSARAAQQMSYGVMPRKGENEIAISPSMAAKFDRNIQNLIGQTVELKYNGQIFLLTVSGIFNAVYDDCFVSADIEQKMFEGLSDGVYSVSYDVIRFEDIVTVSNCLKEQNINSQNASAEVAAFLNTFRNLNRLFLTVSVLILIIGIFISTVLLVKQQNTRFREVGLLSALGYTKSSVRKILFYENIGISLLSVLFSAALIILTLFIGNAVGFSLSFSVWQIAVALCLTAVLILIIGLILSIRLVNAEPAVALKK